MGKNVLSQTKEEFEALVKRRLAGSPGSTSMPNPVQLTDRYRGALTFAFDLHREQRRAGSNVPYFAHLIGVSSLAIEHGADEDEAIAALLHDAAEDQGGRPTLDAIEARYGAKVAAVVEGCTDWLGSGPKPKWRERKQRYVDHLPTTSPSIQLVSACDKLYNARAILADLRTVGDAVWSRFAGRREGVLWYYRSLAAAFNIENPVVDELRRVVDELERTADARVAP
jgi:(p)ppGpp synthase/HD superfamily hydrolase